MKISTHYFQLERLRKTFSFFIIILSGGRGNCVDDNEDDDEIALILALKKLSPKMIDNEKNVEGTHIQGRLFFEKLSSSQDDEISLN